jgi:hypothetical protein
MINQLENYNSLKQLLGCYFHQDWPEEFDNSRQAVQAILEGEPHKQILQGIEEIDMLLSEARSESDWREIIINQIGCYFEPESEGVTYSEWLTQLKKTFQKI